MKTQFKDSQKNYKKVSDILKISQSIEWKFDNSKERIEWVKHFLDRIKYKSIKSKKEKGLVIEILDKHHPFI